MVMLARHGHQYMCFAPDVEQSKVVNHLTEYESQQETRNVLVESARIARGKVSSLESLKDADFDALLLPGGSGALLNLSDFVEKGPSYGVNNTLKNTILKFYQAKKPIGATCIAPIILARALEGHKGIRMTLGSNPANKDELEKLGMKAELAKVHECVVDGDHHIVTTPCYMEPSDLAGMSVGIEAMITSLFAQR